MISDNGHIDKFNLQAEMMKDGNKVKVIDPNVVKQSIVHMTEQLEAPEHKFQ